MLSKSQHGRLAFQHEAIDQIFGQVPPEKLSKQIQAGKWSMQENLAHLVRYQEIFIERIHLMLSGQKPLFARYSAEEDEEFANTRKKSFAELLLDLKKVRQQIITVVHSLSNEQFKNTGTHPVMGSLSLSEWIEFFLLHESHHMMTIFKLAHTQ